MAARQRRGPKEQSPRKRRAEPPLPVTAIDLLAGLAPDVELRAGDLPSGIAREPGAGGPPLPATTTVADTGRLLRAGDDTIRRLIRTALLRPRRGRPDGDAAEPAAEPARAGVLPRTPDKPGE
jgi:hypothetical protein